MTSFLFLDKIEKIQKKFQLSLEYFEYIMENGAFAPKSKCSIFHNIFKYVIFQRRQKALLWSKGLRHLLNTDTDLTYTLISCKQLSISVAKINI